MPAPGGGATRRTVRFLLGVGLICVLFVGGALVAVPAGARQAVLDVDKQSNSCSDDGRGTPRRPYCSIGAAAAAAVPGQRVRVSAGWYDEEVTPARSGRPGHRIVYTAAPGEHVIVHGGAHGFLISGKSWVTVRRFTITATAGAGIKVEASSRVRLVGNDVSRAGTNVMGRTAHGIALRGVTGALVTGNRTHHNSNAGIFVARARAVRVIRNESLANARGYARAAAGIDVRASSGCTVAGNRSHGNEDSGINIWSGSVSTTAVNNSTYRNGDHGIDVHLSSDTRLVSNTVHGNVDSGIEVTGSAWTLIANNISADNGVDSPRTSGNLRVDASSATSVQLSHNLLFLSTPGELIDWAGNAYDSLLAFQSATGREASGIEADPDFLDGSAGDFRLRVRSPAVDSADSGAPGQPATDADGTARTDLGTVPNTGAGPRGYDDRGAYERAP